VEYRLTRDGVEFREAVVPLIRWAANREGWDSKCCPVTCERHDGGEGCQHRIE
jgi:DNA-binding HxlR family transcriptional regulator